MSTPKGKSKPVKQTAVPKIGDNTKITFISARPSGKGGPMTAVLAMVPKKGTITLKALTEKAEADGIAVVRVLKYVKSLAGYGRIELS